MHKKIKSIFFCLPFICGSFCFCFGIFNLASSLLFFVGGYVALKHFFNYKKINKSRHATTENNYQTNGRDATRENSSSYLKSMDRKYSYKEGTCHKSAENIIGLKSYKRDIKIRRRIK